MRGEPCHRQLYYIYDREGDQFLENLEKSGNLTIYVKRQGNLVYFRGT